MMQPLANLHGEILPLSEVRISPLDRSFLFGDAVYEVLRVYDGKAWLENDHHRRLERSLEEIRIRGVALERLRERMYATIAAGPFAEAMVYVHISRGQAPRRHAFPAHATPLELLWVQEYDDGPTARQRVVGTKVITYPDRRWGRCDIKSVNLLANVLANQAAAEAEASEALLYLADGTLSEASHSTFFTVRGGVIETTPLQSNILPGITRNFVVDLARRHGLEVREAVLHVKDLPGVDELFLTGTTSEVLGVTRVDDLKIGDGKPGPVTLRLQEIYAAEVARFRKGELPR